MAEQKELILKRRKNSFKLFIFILIASIFVAIMSLDIAPSTDGVVYNSWYRALSSFNDCGSFEPLFCGASLLMSKAGVSVEYFLSFWLMMCYVICGLVFIKLSPVDEFNFQIVAAWLLLFGFLFYYIYLQPTTVMHLVRQYISGALILLAFHSRNRLCAWIIFLSAIAVHGVGVLFFPAFFMRGSRVKQILLLLSLAVFGAVGVLIPIQVVLSRVFDVVDVVGFYLNIFYLKSAYHKWLIYSTAWVNPVGYPEVSFRGAILITFLYALFPICRNKLKYIFLVLYAWVLLWLFSANDLIFHRIYHYFREFMIVPTFLVMRFFLTISTKNIALIFGFNKNAKKNEERAS